jgi:hypothetical protein
MESKIKKILKKIDSLNEALRKEYSQLGEKYGFLMKQKKIIFLERIREKNKKFI